jgi:hypothetical protein
MDEVSMRAVGCAVIMLLSMVSGCAFPVYPGQPAYSPAAVEKPQRVDFFYGTVIDARPVPVHYRNGGGVVLGLAPGLPLPVIGAGYAQGPGSSISGVTIGPVNVFAEAAVPDVPAGEYTVLLDKKTNPPDPYLEYTQRPAIIIVQNRYPTDLPLTVNDRVFVRVVGSVAHVMRADTLPPSAERIVSAGPLPVPLGYQSPPQEPPCPVHVDVTGIPTVICHPYYPSTVEVNIE